MMRGVRGVRKSIDQMVEKQSEASHTSLWHFSKFNTCSFEAEIIKMVCHLIRRLAIT